MFEILMVKADEAFNSSTDYAQRFFTIPNSPEGISDEALMKSCSEVDQEFHLLIRKILI